MTSLENIIQQVADFYNVNVADLMHGDRRRVFSEPRHVAMYLLHELLGMTTSEIGRHFDKKHPLAAYAVKRVTDWVNDPRLNRRGAACVQTIIDNIKRQKQ